MGIVLPLRPLTEVELERYIEESKCVFKRDFEWAKRGVLFKSRIKCPVGSGKCDECKEFLKLKMYKDKE